MGSEMCIRDSLVDGTVRSITHAQMDVWGLEYYVTLPDEYWSIEDVYERMDVWNSSLLQTLSDNRDRILMLTLEDLLPQRYVMDGDNVITLPYSVVNATSMRHRPTAWPGASYPLQPSTYQTIMCPWRSII